MLRCESSGNWDAPFPTCDEVQCFNPPKIANGRALVDRSLNKSFVIDDHVTYKCDEGYLMGYVKSARCLEDGTWTAPPTCEIIDCEMPSQPEHSTMIGTNYTYGSIVRISCHSGYIASGEVVLECTGSGGWNVSSPECKEIQCPEIQKIKNGAVKGDKRGIGDSVEVVCETGYHASGKPKIICQENGTWDGDLPECKQKTCGPPVSIQNGHYTPEQDRYAISSLVKYKCAENYELEGGKITRTCRVDGTWTGPTPKCSLLKCFHPNEIDHGKLILSDMAFGSEVEYVCDEGYQLEGPPKRICSGDKQWSGSDPVCGEIPCPRPKDILHGSFIIETQGEKVIAKFECEDGYLLKGTQERLCLSTKRWSGLEPYCKIKECDKPADIISNGRMVGTNFSVGASIDYVCDSGYYIDGKTKRTCNKDLQWNNPIPVCERVECPRPLKPPNCYVDGFDFRYTERISYRCKNGYELIGPIERICQADKTWSGGEPKCMPLECPEPDELPNGRILKQGTFYGNTIKYQCNIGYWLVGDAERTCSKDKHWSGEPPKCKKVKCNSPPEIEGGEFVSDQPQPDGSLKYKCKPGFVLAKPGNLTCNKLGNYTGEKPECVEVTCPEPPEIDKGYTLADGRRYGDAVRFVCRPGFTLIGVDLWKCLENGTWSGDKVPSCKKVICLPPPTLKHGSVTVPDGYDFGKTMSVECNAGYELIGEETRTCQADGQWSGAHPKCTEVKCPPPDIHNGYITVSVGSASIKKHLISLDNYVYGMSVNFACEKGYELNGPIEIKCRQNQTWSDSIPTCERIKCPKPNISNSVITANQGFEFDRPITIDCENGYELEGNAILYCSMDGTWNRELPSCKIVSCKAPSIRNGKMKVNKSPNFGLGFPFGIVLGFDCDSGYEMIGSAQSECLGNKEWSSAAPTCKLTFCQAPDLHSRIEIEDVRRNYPYGYAGNYTCKNGYEVSGGEDFQCGSGGQWIGTPPTCNLIECSAPDIRNGYAYSLLTRYISRYSIGVHIYFNCNDGYKLVGSKDSTCQADKSWSDPIPVCEQNMCEDFELDNGKKLSRGDITDYSFGARVSMECDEGYHLQGSSSVVCLKSGNWSQPIPTCIKVICTAPYVSNGRLTVKKQQVEGRYHYGDLIHLDCELGFEIVGAAELMCQLTGEWSSATPKCEPVKCPEPEVNHGAVIVLENLNPTNDAKRRFRFGTIIGFECQDGYVLNGNFDSVCMETATWSSEPPTCDIVTCPELEIKHGLVSSDGLTYGKQLFIDCEPDYELIGDRMLECNENGTWKGNLPVCVRMTCPFVHVLYGHIDEQYQQDAYGYGDTLKISCDTGFKLETDEMLVCQTNRTWSGKSPKCLPFQCKEPPSKIEFGKFELSIPSYNLSEDAKYPFGTNVSILCDVGYGTKVKDSHVKCKHTGEWSEDPFPTCELNICEDPFINNGTMFRNPKTGSYKFGSSVRFKCDDGFTLIGTPETLCDPDGYWIDPFPICDRKACPAPETPNNAEIYGDSHLFADELLFKCKEGYEVIGSAVSTCQADQTWTPFPSCKEIRCPLPVDIKNGEYMAKGFGYGDMIRYSCFKGYTLVGSADHICTGNKTWSGTLPSCNKLQCPNPEPIRFARFIGDSFSFEDRVKIECEKGFKLIGEDSMVCQSNGEWSSTESTQCLILTCSIPKVIAHGVYRASNRFVYNSTVTYECDSGYELQGNWAITCDETGEWNSEAPHCTRIYCNPPPQIENGFIEGSQYPAGAKIRYHCNEGFIQVGGDMTRECTNNRTWTGVVPKCTVILCELQWDIDNGQILSNDNRYGAVIQYVCNEGYELNGPIFRRCEANGNWNVREPICAPITCTDPVKIDNGYIIGNDYTYNSVITYACKDNYDISGDITRTCKADRTWSGTTAHCRIKKCSPPRQTSIEHGEVMGDDYSAGSALRFQCDEGYKLSGPQSVVCQGGSSWSSEFPQCDKVSCGLPPMLENAIVDGNAYEYGEKVKFRCKKGYYIVGDAKTICQQDGSWSVVRARCNPISCGHPPKIPFTIMTGDSFSFGDFVYYKCKDGLELRGNNLLQCNAYGKWKGELPSCQEVSCGFAPVIPHASVIVSKTTFGSQVTYNCNRGYVLMGDPKMVCIANGTWAFVDRPRCDPIDCKQPPQISSGGYKVQNTTLHHKVKYFCDEGYSLVGDEQLTCSPEGAWNGTHPACLPVLCTDLEEVEHGSYQNHGLEFSSDVVYQCDIGYQLTGDKVRVCQADGSWSGTKSKRYGLSKSIAYVPLSFPDNSCRRKGG